MREMVTEQRDVFYYVTLMNENYAQPDLPEGVEADVVRRDAVNLRAIHARTMRRTSPILS